MMSTIYRTNWIPIALLFFALVFLIGIVDINRAVSREALLKGVGIMFLGTFAIVLLIAKATYITITQDGYIKNLDFLFFRKKAKIQNITRIERASMYKGLGPIFGYVTFVYFTDERGKEDAFQIKNNLYKEATLADIIRNLREINHSIKLDTACEKLMAKANKK